MTEKKNVPIYIIGGVAGALLGIGISHILVQTTEKENTSLELSPQKGLQIGINTIGFVRSLLELLKKT